MLLRQRPPEGFYTYPAQRHGVGGLVRRALWRLGFDPLTAYERLAQVRRENAYWKRRLEEAQDYIAELRAACGELAEDRERIMAQRE